MASEAAQHLRKFLESIGLDFDAEPELARTPERVEEFFGDVLAGTDDAPPTMSTFDADDHGRPVLLTGLGFHSMCVHHLVPFFGTIDIAYVPSETMAGFGSFGRIIEFFARRPQIQERLVTQIAEHIADELSPAGLLVRCRARQLCVEMRTTRKRGTFTSVAARGSLSSGELRREVMHQFTRAERAL